MGFRLAMNLEQRISKMYQKSIFQYNCKFFIYFLDFVEADDKFDEFEFCLKKTNMLNTFSNSSKLKIYLVGRMGTVARWSSIRPDCKRIISEKKSSSGTVVPRAPWFLLWIGGCSSLSVSTTLGNADLCSSILEP